MGAFLFARAVPVLSLLLAGAGDAPNPSGKTVLFLNSYHKGYAWSDGEETGAENELAANGLRFVAYRMDTKRHPESSWLEQQHLKILGLIEKEQPDLVIAADDNATRVMVEHFNGTRLPWVFCGVNWDASHYGLPFSNATGMLEVSLTRPVMERLLESAHGKRMGFLTADTETERTEGRAYREKLQLRFDREVYVKTFKDWKAAFLQMQKDVDVLYVGNFAGINDWDAAEAHTFVFDNSRIPSGSTYDFMMPYVMLGMTKVAEEQGRWAAQTAVAILKGAAPSSIAVTADKEQQLYVNLDLASRAKVKLPVDLVKRAKVTK